MGGKKWKAMNRFGDAQRKANPRKAKGKSSRFGFIVTISILLLIVAAVWVGTARTYGYTDPANCTGATLNDMRVNPSQSVTWTPGPFLNSTGDPVGGGNSSLYFNGVDQYVSAVDSASLDTILSVEARVYVSEDRPDTGPNVHVIAIKGDSWLGGISVTQIDGADQFYSDWKNAVAAQSTATYTIPAYGKWYHIIAQVNTTSNKAQLWVNGVLRAEGGAVPNLSVNNGDTFKVAGGVVGRYFNDTVDEVRAYSRTLSPTEIAQHYQGIYLVETGLVLYLDFDGEVLDQSVEGNNGTLNNGPVYIDGWASVPVSTYFNGTISVDSRRILVNSTTGDVRSTIPDTAPAGVGVYEATLAPDNTIENGTIPGFIVDHYLLEMDSMFTETEAGFQALIICTGESVVDGHEVSVNDTATVEGVSLTGNTYTGRLEGVDTKATAATVTYDTVNSFLEDTYGITSAEVNTSVTVTWTTGTLDRLQTKFMTGDWIGSIFDEEVYLVGSLTFYTVVMLMFSVGIYNYSGVYTTFVFWLLGWGVFAGLVHGTAQVVAVLLFTLGMGVTLAKLYLDRRTT